MCLEVQFRIEKEKQVTMDSLFNHMIKAYLGRLLPLCSRLET